MDGEISVSALFEELFPGGGEKRPTSCRFLLKSKCFLPYGLVRVVNGATAFPPFFFFFGCIVPYPKRDGRGGGNGEWGEGERKELRTTIEALCFRWSVRSCVKRVMGNARKCGGNGVIAVHLGVFLGFLFRFRSGGGGGECVERLANVVCVGRFRMQCLPVSLFLCVFFFFSH